MQVSIGLPEIAIFLVIALIVFGPKRLPELGRSIGDGLRVFKASVSGERPDDEDEDEGPTQIDNEVEDAEVEDAELAEDEGVDEPVRDAERSPS
jgi:sec-independent protein translocase protein TatA